MKFLYVILSGLLLTAAFPKAGISGLAWVALVPLLFSLRNLPAKEGFRMGFLAGLAHYLTLMYWLVHTMQTYGHLPFYLAIPLLFLLAAYMALYVGLFAALTTRLNLTSRTGFWLLPLCWTGLEYVRALALTGFPWELLGYSLYQHLHLIQISDIFGVYGVSFLIVLCNGAILLTLLHFRNRRWQGLTVSRGLAGSAVVAFALVLGITLEYGSWRIKQTDQLAAASLSAKVAVVQGNIDQMVKWQPAHQKSSTEKYIGLSLSAKADKPDLIVWPETAAPFYFNYDMGLTNRVIRGVREAATHFLIGCPSFAPGDGQQIDYYNSAYLIGPDGEAAGKYNKVHLVPFGEYVPLQRWLPFVRKIVAQVGNFRTGQKGDTLTTGRYRLGTLICYEIIFPDLSGAAVRNGAELLVNITNDAWYGTTSAPHQHFSMAVFRAVENKRALVRSANTGISGFADPVGRITGATPLFEDAVMTRTVPLMNLTTFYTRFGDLFAMLCLGGTVLFISSVLTGHRFRQKAVCHSRTGRAPETE